METLKSTAPSWTIRSAESAEKEAARVAASLEHGSAVVVTGAAATEQAVWDGAGAARVLHVAAPFRINAASPLFSPILLARGDAAVTVLSQNGILEAREIPAAALASRLALFSDPAALSMREGAAAVTTLQWILRAGGIETLIVRRWGSDEAATTDLLATFYERLRSGASPASALDGARLPHARPARPLRSGRGGW